IVSGVKVVGELVAPVGDIENAVRPHETIHRAQTIVIANQEIYAEVSGEAGGLWLQHVPVDGVRQEVAGDVSVVERLGKRAALVENAAASHMAAFESLVRHVLEIAKGKWIVQRTVLSQAFN